MTYSQLRALHFAAVPNPRRAFLERNLAKAHRVHSALLDVSARRGAGWVVQNRREFARSVRTQLDVAGLLAPLFQWALVKLVELLLPIFIAWLESQLAQPQSDPSARTLDAQLKRLAEESQQ